MRAIIDTCEDVKLLVQREIIQQIELSDQVVEDLFNGMRKSIRPTNTLDLEKEIKKVNAKYDDSQKVNRAMVKYVYSAGKFYTVVLKTMFEVFPEALTLTTDLYEALLKVIDKEETKQLEKDMLLIGGNANCSPLESKAKGSMRSISIAIITRNAEETVINVQQSTMNVELIDLVLAAHAS
ncbi:hypothetical protein JHK82_015862 [Glycine max]|nr:hypothetical protein JHK86_015889 [Glycine max]KAG5148981.1 hypothetical protein JHK82_015862 [Glycine max]